MASPKGNPDSLFSSEIFSISDMENGMKSPTQNNSFVKGTTRMVLGNTAWSFPL